MVMKKGFKNLKKMGRRVKETAEKGKMRMCMVGLFVLNLFSPTSTSYAVVKYSAAEAVKADTVADKIVKAGDWLTLICSGLAFVSVIIGVAIPHIAGGQEGAAKGKKTAINIAIGLGVAVFAAQIVKLVISWLE